MLVAPGLSGIGLSVLCVLSYSMLKIVLEYRSPHFIDEELWLKNKFLQGPTVNKELNCCWIDHGR